MDILTFLSNIINSLAWPLTLVIAILLLRKPLRELFPFIQKLKYKEIEIEFGRQVKEVRKELAEKLAPMEGKLELTITEDKEVVRLAEISPRYAVMEAWRRVELAALDAARKLGGDAFRNKTFTFKAIGFLERQEKLDRSIISTLRDLRGLRNQAAHAPEFALTKESAIDYSMAADSVIKYLHQNIIDG
jgi:hypothetical protein